MNRTFYLLLLLITVCLLLNGCGRGKKPKAKTADASDSEEKEKSSGDEDLSEYLAPTAEELVTMLTDYYGELRSVRAQLTQFIPKPAASLRKQEKVRMTIQLMRPNLCALHMQRGDWETELISDGKRRWIHTPALKMYSQGNAPADFDALLDDPEVDVTFAPRRPFLWTLLGPDPYEQLMQDSSLELVGEVDYYGIRAYHLKLKRNEVQTELWIAKGKFPNLYQVLISRVPQAGDASAKPEVLLEERYNKWVTRMENRSQFRFSTARNLTEVKTYRGGDDLIGKPAPTFGPRRRKGRRGSSSSLNRTALYFWMSWSPRCEQELRDIRGVHDDFWLRGWKVRTVNVFEKEDDAKTFLTAAGIQLPPDPVFESRGGQIAKNYDARGVPMVVIVDARGIVRNVYVGVEKSVADVINQEIDTQKLVENLASETDLVGYLAHEDSRVRQRAAALLAGEGPEIADRVVGILAAHQNPETRYLALVILNRLITDHGVKPEMKPIIQAFRDEDRTVRAGALAVASKLSGHAEDALLDALENEDSYYIRAYAMQALANLRCGKAVESIADQLYAAEDALVRSTACESLARLGAIHLLTEALGSEQQDVQEAARNLLIRIGDAGVPAVAKALEDPKTHQQAQTVLQTIRTRDALESLRIYDQVKRIRPDLDNGTLVDALDSQYDRVREKAGEVLAAKGPQSIPVLVQALQDRRSRVREGAATALRGFGKEAVPVLVEALEADNSRLRRGACRALAELGPEAKGAVDALARLLGDKNEDVREQAARALAAVGEAALKPLKSALENDNRTIHEAAGLAFGFMGTEAVPVLVESLKHEKNHVRYMSAYALGEMGPPAKDALPALKQLVQQDTNPTVRSYSLRAIDKIDK